MPDKKQTALQELIKYMKDRLSEESAWDSKYCTSEHTAGYQSAFSHLVHMANGYLSKEKEQIKSAFDTGANSELCKPETYFNETYITQDK